MILVDVRTAEEYANGHRPDALNIPVQDIMRGSLGKLADMSLDTEIGCYCASGARSAVACQVLGSRGFTRVQNLGGY